jgi:hypothetical protein
MQEKNDVLYQFARGSPLVRYSRSSTTMQDCHHTVVHCSCYSKFAGMDSYETKNQKFHCYMIISSRRKIIFFYSSHGYIIKDSSIY